MKTLKIIEEFSKGSPLEKVVGTNARSTSSKVLRTLADNQEADLSSVEKIPQNAYLNDNEKDEGETVREEAIRACGDGGILEVEPSYLDIQTSVFDTSFVHLDEYMEEVTKYLDEWKRVNRTRIRAGLYKFTQLSEKLNHYKGELSTLNKKKKNEKEKLEWNEQKLFVVQEAHDAHSEKLLRFIEEVTHRGWKDFYPFLLRIMQFDLSYTARQFKSLSHLVLVREGLKEIGNKYELQQCGRLQELQEEPLGYVFTGIEKLPKLPHVSVVKVGNDVLSSTSNVTRPNHL